VHSFRSTMYVCMSVCMHVCLFDTTIVGKHFMIVYTTMLTAVRGPPSVT
jgi:hypothetical protein